MLSESRARANKKWDESHKYQKKVYRYRSASRRFLKSYANLKDLKEAEKLIIQRRNVLKEGLTTVKIFHEFY